MEAEKKAVATESITEAQKDAVAQALAILAGAMAQPGVHWTLGDDKCDCTFQQIGEWTNPYIGQTLRVRLCCIWEELYKMFPQHVERINAFYDYNRDRYVKEPREWDNTKADMPVYLWLRQLAKKTGKSLSEIRQEYKDRLHERPKRVKKPVQDVPTVAERKAARRAQLKRAGWLLK